MKTSWIMKFFWTLSPLLLVLVTGPLFSSCNKQDEPLEPATECHTPTLPANPKAAAYQALVDSYIQKGLPGVVVYIKTPRDGVWVGAAGKANLQTGELMRPCTLNYPQSIAKTFTATAVMQLVEEGKVDLDTRITAYLPATITGPIRNADQATVRQLLNHTSGITNYLEDEAFVADEVANPLRTYTAEQYLNYIAGDPPYFAPGAGYRYSDTNFLLAALLIDQVTGRSHAYRFTERIFQPLGLRDIYYKNEPGYPRPRGLVSGNYFDRDGDSVLEDYSGFETASVSSFLGDDGLISSAYDLGQFIEALGKGKLVNGQSLQQMTRWVDTGITGTQYGLGLFGVDTPYGRAFGHSGSGVGAAAQMYYLPALDLTLVAFTNIGTYFDSPARDVFENKLTADLLALATQ
ncbi:beta-lactamase family protein [Hymenobacter sp. BT664]|uniref:Beta-lactamase family protein n=1 Tax=Hymenobacter montanus TaxID=2771359 RepID=A0A927BA18_9BACT|nr:serine hydrolase domain-containing protein [Hymenobacter montanus]MBD2766910.1 beta-lactamase family protein [Hymenobacter montanus]